MKLVIVADDISKEEFLSIGFQENIKITWLKNSMDLNNNLDADAVIDLLFNNDESRISLLNTFMPRPVIINSVVNTLGEINDHFIRINGWPGFLNREIVEAACTIDENKKEAEKIFKSLGRKTEWIKDVPGFITARIISMIINEAFLALEEKVSSKTEIDTAMKLGTNYPFGPFEWTEKIGAKNILDLLNVLSKKEKRYQPAPLLIKEAKEK